MKIYKIAQDFEEGIEDTIKSIKYKCPNTGISVVIHFHNQGDGKWEQAQCELYHDDGSFVDTFDNFWHAKNWAKKHLDENCKIPNLGIRVAGKKQKKYKKLDTQLFPECTGTDEDRDVVKKHKRRTKKASLDIPYHEISRFLNAMGINFKNQNDGSLAVERDSMVQRSKGNFEEDCYKDILSQINKNFSNENMRFYWTGKTDDHLFLGAITRK